MHSFAFVLAALSLTGFASAKPLDDQVLSPDDHVEAFAGWSWTNCGHPTDPLHIESIALFPDPPKIGVNLTITAEVVVRETIEDGAFLDAVVKAGLIKIIQKRLDICQGARNMNLTVQCPVQPGPYIIEHTVSLPKETPRAKFSFSARGYTVDEEDLFCADFQVNFIGNF